MRRLALALALALGVIHPPALSARMFSPIALIAHTIGVGATNGTTTGAINTSGANFCVVAAGFYSGVTSTVSVSDSKGNTYTSRPASAEPMNNIKLQMWYVASATVGSSHTFSVSGTSTFSNVAAACFSNVASSPFDNDQNGNIAFDNDLLIGNMQPNNNNAVYLSAVAWNTLQSGAMTVDNGLTITDQADAVGGASEGVALAYLVQTTSTNFDVTWHAAVCTAMAGTSIAFDQSGGGGAAFPGAIINTPIRGGGRGRMR